ncbi:MAG: acyl-CoA thioesterase [Candidatus Eiseniibacteriota bacterium]
MSFRATFPIRFQDVDAGGVLFFGRIFDYCHQAYEEFIATSGVDRARYFAGAEYLVPIAHAEADYVKPIRHGEQVVIHIDVTRVGRASFRLRHRVTGTDGDLRVEAQTVHAFVERTKMKPIPIPDSLRGFFESHLVPDPVEERAAK